MPGCVRVLGVGRDATTMAGQLNSSSDFESLSDSVYLESLQPGREVFRVKAGC